MRNKRDVHVTPCGERSAVGINAAIALLVSFLFLLLSPAAPASHNDFRSAPQVINNPPTELAAYPAAAYIDDHWNIGATYSAAEESYICGGAVYGESVWYRFYAAQNGVVQAAARVFQGQNGYYTYGVGIRVENTANTVWTCNTATGGDNALTGILPVTAGQYYYIQVGTTYYNAADIPEGYYRVALVYDRDTDGDGYYDGLSPDYCPSEPGDIAGTGEQGCRKDRDGDGHARPVANGDDCDDQNARRYPGNPDIPRNGIDEDCDGKDNTDADRDGYGTTAQTLSSRDCNDNDPGIHPGAREVPGNWVDENCNGRADPAALDPSPTATAKNKATKKGARFKRLKVTGVAPGYLIRVTCTGRGRGCKSRSKTAKSRNAVTLSMPRFLRAGGKVEVRITLPGQNRIGEYVRYDVRKGKLPKRTNLCIYPGKKKPRKC